MFCLRGHDEMAYQVVCLEKEDKTTVRYQRLLQETLRLLNSGKHVAQEFDVHVMTVIFVCL